MQRKESSIGLIPAHWDLVELDEVLESRLGKMLSKASRTGESPHPYLRNSNVQWGHFDLSDVAEMDFTPDELVKFELRVGDVLVCEGGEVGRCAVWHNELPGASFQKALHRVRPRGDSITSEFFAYHMMHAFTITGSYGVVGTTTTIAHLPGVKLKSLGIPLPPRNEQDRITSYLEAVDRKVNSERQHLDALNSLFSSLLSELMSGQRRIPESMWESAA